MALRQNARMVRSRSQFSPVVWKCLKLSQTPVSCRSMLKALIAVVKNHIHTFALDEFPINVCRIWPSVDCYWANVELLHLNEERGP